jgi:hypothetical protein
MSATSGLRSKEIAIEKNLYQIYLRYIYIFPYIAMDSVKYSKDQLINTGVRTVNF